MSGAGDETLELGEHGFRLCDEGRLEELFEFSTEGVMTTDPTPRRGDGTWAATLSGAP